MLVGLFHHQLAEVLSDTSHYDRSLYDFTAADMKRAALDPVYDNALILNDLRRKAIEEASKLLGLTYP